MLRDSAFDLAPVVLRELATTPYYSVVESVVPPVIIPPPPRVGGGGGPWTRVENRPLRRLDFWCIAVGGVAVSGAADMSYDTASSRSRRRVAEEDWLIWGLPYDLDDL